MLKVVKLIFGKLWTLALLTLGLLVLGWLLYRPVVAAAVLAFNHSNEIDIAEYRLKNLSTSQFQAEIKTAVDEEDYGLSKDLLSLAREQGHSIPSKLAERADLGLSVEVYRHVKDTYRGAVDGDMSTAGGVVGAFASDMTGFGDLRDVVVEGSSAVRGKDYDGLTLGLAVIGLAISGTTIASVVATPATGGSSLAASKVAGAANAGVSIIKNTHKLGKLTSKFRRQLGTLTKNAINLDAFNAAYRRLNLDALSLTELPARQLKSIQSQLAKVVRTKRLKQLSSQFVTLWSIRRAGGTRAAVKALELTDTAANLRKFKKVAGHFKAKTFAVLNMIGKGAIELVGLIWKLVSWVIGGVIWLVATLATLTLTARQGYRLLANWRPNEPAA